MYAEERIKAELRQEALARGKAVKPSHRREMARKAVGRDGTSVRLVCDVFGISQSCYRYQCKLGYENAQIADWLLRLTTTHKLLHIS